MANWEASFTGRLQIIQLRKVLYANGQIGASFAPRLYLPPFHTWLWASPPLGKNANIATDSQNRGISQ
jgi:hypothetical protein